MQLTVGEIVEGKVTGITNFGVFVDLGENQTGMVHISEVAQTYVNDINEHVKQGDTVKMKVLSVGDDGKVSLSIKRAEEPKRRERKPFTAPKPDNSFVWTERKDESASFEDMMNKFKQVSDDKFSDLTRKNAETSRSRRGTK